MNVPQLTQPMKLRIAEISQKLYNNHVELINYIISLPFSNDDKQIFLMSTLLTNHRILWQEQSKQVAEDIARNIILINPNDEIAVREVVRKIHKLNIF